MVLEVAGYVLTSFLCVRQLCEKFLAAGKDLFWAFIDL